MPKLAMAMNEGTINEWLVADGSHINKGSPVMVVETEKVSYDVEAPVSGFLHIILPVGETVPVETLVAKITDTEEEWQSLQGATAPASDEKSTPAGAAPVVSAAAPAAALTTARIKASPLARKLAAEAGLDLASVPATGPGGRIVKRDVLAAKNQVTAGPAAAASAQSIRVPMKGTMRGTIARRMMESLQTAAQLSASWETDITRLLKVRQKFLAIEDQLGTRVSINAFIARAMALALKQVPIANASIEGDDIVLHASVNIGVAIALPGNTEIDTRLVVPVLHNVEQLGVVEIDKRIKAIIARAREGALTAQEMNGATVTLSSTAGIAPAGLTSTPVLNLPNALLVGPSTPIERPLVRKGKIVVRTMLPISATFDHRILDGEPFSRFARALHDLLETPELMLA
ncbi:MAG: 2-oxo acid dehydrogenase subunit E2 [Pseudomonadales bacterium]|nr:2-oxo acid dehydrogenase subunit E2 [Pseudomonadales bacterium]MCP5191482.1 2-oxo acid dehydrogenase subunit E2 [Pseudomonadales bacterium]